MGIRSKMWLLVAVSLVLTAVATLWLRIYAMRRELVDRSMRSAHEVAEELVDSLERLEANAADADLALLINNTIDRHANIQRLQLLVDRETPSSPSFRIVAPRGEQLQITRVAPL